MDSPQARDYRAVAPLAVDWREPVDVWTRPEPHPQRGVYQSKMISAHPGKLYAAVKEKEAEGWTRVFHYALDWAPGWYAAVVEIPIEVLANRG